MSFSNGGGTLALPSPTHAHNMDVTAAVRKLGRSISRSPSKMFLARDDLQNPDGLQRASPQHSPCRRASSTPAGQQHRQSPLSSPQTAPPALQSSNFAIGDGPHQSAALTPLRPGVKLSLRSTNKAPKTSTPSRITRARASPKSPLKRALSATPDSGNSRALPSPLLSPGKKLIGQENTISLRSTPRKGIEKSRHPSHLDSGPTQIAFLKALDTIIDPPMVAAAGALKRSDATMNLDQPNQGSPVAKRRSVLSIAGPGQEEDSSGTDTHTGSAQSFDIHEDSSLDDDPFPSQQAAAAALATAIPKRSTSLRKSTLQQRYGDKNSGGKRSGERQLALFGGDSTPVRTRPPISMEQFMPPKHARESPFGSANVSTTSAPLNTAHTDLENRPRSPHRLSHSFRTSSSGNNLVEETQTPKRAPPKVIEKLKAHPFSRSLPLNAVRPVARHSDFPQAVATPLHDSSNLLWSAAFNSTGLVSKINRNPEEEADRKMAPPDTPCKKHTNPFGTYPPSSSSAMKKRSQVRNSIVGLPSTPFDIASTRTPDASGSNAGKGLSIFQRSTGSKSIRRGSLLGLDIEDRRPYSGILDVSSFLEEENPLTPTRNSLNTSPESLSETSLESPSTGRNFGLSISAAKAVMPRGIKSKPTLESPSSSNERVGGSSSDSSRPTPPKCGPSPDRPAVPPFSSCGRSRTRRGYSTPPPLVTETPTVTKPIALPLKSTSKSLVKIACDLASPIAVHRSPQTPQESLLPLDTSRLSISRVGDGLGENGRPPPVTPTTTARDFRSSASIFVTPVNGRTNNLDIDASLYSRFDKVEQIGKGEFSTVFRVTKASHKNSFNLSTETPVIDSRSPSNGQIFAVKKSKQPYSGHKDRQAKLREARILRALAHSEHVVQYVDEWEHNSHLYIQTEFCEEGTLDKFLSQVGRSGRLDDFRIFKILQDLCLGLREIHTAGYMHLDLKPANIFITFEGALKIGDFGLAQSSSAAEKVDIEGDREYMAPEMLNGQASQAADVFSLGLMTLETAANVVLPENGPTWVALRSGDLSEVPSLTWTPSVEVQRDISGNPTEPEPANSDDVEDRGSQGSRGRGSGNLFGSFKRTELQQPPEFMVEAFHPSSLDSIVKWMTQEHVEDRPGIGEVLALESLQWVAEHRNAPATVYEGNWGPVELFPVSVSTDDDTVMMDV